MFTDYTLKTTKTMPFCQENDLKHPWQVVCLYLYSCLKLDLQNVSL